MYMKGGLILTEPSLQGFTPVLQMIQNGEIGLLTYEESLVGIIFTLTVPPENSKYIDIKRQIQTEFVIKLVLISNPRTTYSLPNLSREFKVTMSKDNFLNEARIQQKVWTDSILYGGEEFSPSLVNFALFNNEIGKILLRMMMMNKYNDVFPVLIDLLTTNPTFEIGVLVMPNILNTRTLIAYKYEIIKIHDNRVDTIEYYLHNAYKNSILNILRLYFFHKIIIRDLHESNILISNDKLQNSHIIDFGYIIDAASIDSKNFKKNSEAYYNSDEEDSDEEDSEEEDSDEVKEATYRTNLLTFNSLCDEAQQFKYKKDQELNLIDNEDEYRKQESVYYKKNVMLTKKIKNFIYSIIMGIIEKNRKYMRWLPSYIRSEPEIFGKLCMLKHKHHIGDGFDIRTLSRNEIFDLSFPVDSYYFEIAAPTAVKTSAKTVIKKKTIAKRPLLKNPTRKPLTSTRKKGGKKIKKTRRQYKSKKSNKSK